MKFTPRPYQSLMIEHIVSRPRCALWAGMGLGKTVATLTALDCLYLAGMEEKPTLVLAPLRVARSVWPEEAKKWDGLRHIEVQPILGSAVERADALRTLKKGNKSVYTMNYDNIPWLMNAFKEWPFGTVVADESTRLKNFRLRQGGKRTQFLAKIAHKHTCRWVNLTGTPAPNGLADLWGQTWFIDGGHRLGRSFTAFRERWFTQSFDGFSIEPREFASEQIQELLKDACLTIDAKDWFDLKQPIVNNVYVDLPSKAMRLYKDMEKQMFAEIDGSEVEAFNAAAKTMKCLQLANGAAYVDDKGSWKETHDAKIQALESIIEEAAGAPVLVAYHFKSDLARLLRAFPKGRTLDSDPKTISEWNTGRISILFAHPASAGHGLNLQDGGNIIVFFGHWWDLEQYQQIIERIGPVRQAQAGHERPVFIHHILARGTVDEIVMQRRESKREVQDLLMGAMKHGR
jgi:SNF2 family DNA or RNA helicase